MLGTQKRDTNLENYLYRARGVRISSLKGLGLGLRDSGFGLVCDRLRA